MPPVLDLSNAAERGLKSQRAMLGSIGAEHDLPALSWRERAGFGRHEIVVLGISEGTAIPAGPLLEELAALGAGAWHHFFDWRHG